MAVFELNHGAHHDHIVCVDCGRVEEFMDGGIEDRQQAVAKRLGFEISDHSLILYGHCRKPIARIKSARSSSGRDLRQAPAPRRRRAFFLGGFLRRSRASISRACARASAVISMPPDMRAISSMRSAALKVFTAVRVMLPSLRLVTRNCRWAWAATCARWSRTAPASARRAPGACADDLCDGAAYAASTSSNTMHREPLSADVATCTARLMRDSSPPRRPWRDP